MVYKTNMGVYRGEDCIKKFCKSLTEHAMKIINKRTARIIRKDKNLLHLQKKYVHQNNNDKNHCKVRDHCHYTGE